MSFMIVIAAAFIGALVGIAGDDGSVGAFGFLVGAALGCAFAWLRAMAARIENLHRELNALKAAATSNPRAAALPASNAEPSIAADELIDIPAAAPAVAASVPTAAAAHARAADTGLVIDLGSTVPPSAPRTAAPVRPPPAPPSTPDPIARAAAGLKRWFSEGNVPVKIGMLVLFAGIAALLKYASDEGWLRLPIEFRLAGIALAALAALAFGWRERVRRRSFGLGLQGGAIGILVMTVFAAFRLYHLLPAPVAFTLLVIFVACIGVLAVVQNARALAVLGILAGFAAPILISSGSGNHVVLFSYYALLNLAILAIARVRSWRALNLLGFFFTFSLGSAWGLLSYRADMFATTEAFLLLYFAIYLAIPILGAERREQGGRNIVEGSLVFGNPLIAFALQSGLLEGERMPLAYCAVGLAIMYALLAWRLLPRARVLGESFAVLATGFATLAVPLALSARVSACTFALEGAGLIWLGLREQRLLPRISGLALQVIAALAFALALAFGRPEVDPMPIANSLWISACLIEIAAFISAWLYWSHGKRRGLALLLYLWALAWWLGAGLNEIDAFVRADLQVHAVLGLVALSAFLAAIAFARLRSSALAWTIAGAHVSAFVVVAQLADTRAAPFAGWGAVAFASYAAMGFIGLRALRDAGAMVVAIAQIAWLWTWTFAIALALIRFATQAELGAGWHAAFALAPLLGVWASALMRPQWITAPLAARFAEYRGALLATYGTIGSIAFAALLTHAGASAPLPYLPLLNPLDLAQIALLVCFARWLADPAAPAQLAAIRPILIAGGAFALLTAATLRGVHHLGAVAWDAGLWSSSVAQAALTVVWSIAGVLGWIRGSRRGNRTLWLASAALMAIVLAKLLLIDRNHLGNLFGIASFIAYGLLCTVIGFFAPAPPRAQSRGAA